MTRRSLAGLIVISPSGFLLGKPATTLLTDESDRKTWAWLLQRYGEKEAPKKRGKKVEHIGMTNKGPYDVAIMLNDKGQVIRARFNHGNFTNDEWAKLAGFRHMIDLTCWHNFKKNKQDQPKPDLEADHDLSGSGLIAFKKHPLKNLNIGGSTFNNFGLATLGQLPNFRKIMAYHTRVNDEGLIQLAGDDHIRFLNLGPQFTMRISEKSLESIGQMKALVELEFNETRVTWNAGLKHLLPLKNQLKRVKLDKTWIDDGCLEKARKAFPKTTFEHSGPNAKQIEQMKKRLG